MRIVILTLNGVKGKNPSDVGLYTSLGFFLPSVIRMTAAVLQPQEKMIESS
jgi:hypothetical protein